MRLIFGTPHSAKDYIKDHGFRGFLWLIWHHPKVAHQLLSVHMVVLLTGSKNCHVMVENCGRVWDHRFLDTKVATLRQASKWNYHFTGHINLYGVIGQALDWERDRYRKDSIIKATIGFYLLGITRGLVRFCLPVDCVTETKKYLAESGYQVPDRIWTPQQLIDWIDEQGRYKFDHRCPFLGDLPCLEEEAPHPRHRRRQHPRPRRHPPTQPHRPSSPPGVSLDETGLPARPVGTPRERPRASVV